MSSQGLLIVGVGRSGTSIAAKLASDLGLRLPRSSDLMRGNFANPGGYWESESLVGLNDRLLLRWNCSWWTPPPSITLSKLEALDDLKQDAIKVFTATFGTQDGWIWKDPRLTILMPFWEQVLGTNPICFPFRSPQAVARSLALRDGLTYEQGLAVWERHTRLALEALAGRQVAVADYDSLCTDPDRWQSDLMHFCREVGLAVYEPTESADRQVAESATSKQGWISDHQFLLFETLRSVTGFHPRFAALDLPEESTWVNDRLGEVTIPSWGSRIP